MGKLICLVGKSGVGKSCIEEMLWKLNYKKVVSYTSRAIRAGEINTVDYNFVTKEQFLEFIESGEVIEHTERYGNYYGIGQHCIDLSKGDYVCTVDPKGYFSLKEHFGDDVVGIYIYIDDHERLVRLLNREKDVEKANFRFNTDNEVFERAEKQMLYRVPNVDVKTSANTIDTLIMRQIRARRD